MRHAVEATEHVAEHVAEMARHVEAMTKFETEAVMRHAAELGEDGGSEDGGKGGGAVVTEAVTAARHATEALMPSTESSIWWPRQRRRWCRWQGEERRR